MCWVLVGDIVILRRKPGATYKSLHRYVSPVPPAERQLLHLGNDFLQKDEGS